MPIFFDTHAHLNFPRFEDDRSDVIAAFQALGVEYAINVGTNEETTRDSIALAQAYPGKIFATAGCHPHYVNEHSEESFVAIAELARAPEVVAIGEIGLDYFKNPAAPEQQRTVFRRYLQLAVELELPVVIHCRDAFEDCRAILEEFLPLKAGGEFHCYTGDLAFAQWLVSQNLMVAFNGIVTYKNAPDMQEVAAAIDKDFFLLETDCPYLAPQSRRGSRNDPSAIPEIAAKVAELRGIDLEEVAALSTANAKRLFLEGRQ